MTSLENLVLNAQSRILPLEQRQDAFAELVDRFRNLIQNRATQMLGDAYLAQDAVQETFLSAWQNLSQLQHPHAFPTWLKRILHTQCSRAHRHKCHHQVLNDETHVSPAQLRPDTQAELKDLRLKIRDAIAELPEHERIVTEMFYLEGHSQRDISRLIDIPVKTIKSRLYTSRQRLHKWLEDLFEEDTKPKRPVRIASQLRADQATNMAKTLPNVLASVRIESIICLEREHILVYQPVTDTVSTQTLPVAQISGAIAPTST